MLAMNRIAIIICAAAGSVANSQTPQRPVLDSSLSALVAKNIGYQERLVEALRNSARYSNAQRNSLADYLTTVAIQNRSGPFQQGDSATYAAAARAVTVLGHSSMREYPGMEPNLGGEPYAGALDRLIRVAQNSPVDAIRERCLRVMLGAADRSRALEFVRSVAAGPDTSAAEDAVRVLIEDASGHTTIPHQTPAQRDQSLSVLRELAATHGVTSRSGSRQVDVWLRNRKP